MADAPPPATESKPANPTTPTTPAVPDTKATITFDEFAKLDLRVARVVAAVNHPSADKLLKLTLDDGSGTARQICAGIRADYTAESMVGKLIVIVANLAPRVIRGEESRGMLLAASNVPKDAGSDTPRRVVVLSPSAEIAPGSIVS